MTPFDGFLVIWGVTLVAFLLEMLRIQKLLINILFTLKKIEARTKPEVSHGKRFQAAHRKELPNGY